MLPKLQAFLLKYLTVLIGIAVLALLAWGGWRWWQSKLSKAHIKKADQAEVVQQAAGAVAAGHEQTAGKLEPINSDNAAKVARSDAQVARDRAKLDQVTHPAGNPANPFNEPLPRPADPISDAKDALIISLTQEVADLKQQAGGLIATDTERKLALLSRQEQVQALQTEVKELRIALALRPKTLHWGVGGIKGSGNTYGATVEYDWGVVRIGTDIVHRQVASGQSSNEALVRVIIKL